MCEKRIYRPLNDLTKLEIIEVIERNDIEELIRLPLSVGENYPDWKYAQDLCVRLSDHEDARVRATAVLGLAYIARTKGRIEKHIVKPIILRELRENKEFEWRIIDAIDDINLYMNWTIGGKARKRDEEKTI